MTGEAGTPGYPELLHAVIDTTKPRKLAEFYRRLLGYVYRTGDEDEPVYVFVDPSGHPFCIFVA